MITVTQPKVQPEIKKPYNPPPYYGAIGGLSMSNAQMSYGKAAPQMMMAAQ